MRSKDRQLPGWVCKGAAIADGEPQDRPLVNLEKPWRRIRARATVRLWAKHSNDAVRALVERLTQEKKREPTAMECLRDAATIKLELPPGLLDVRLHDLRHSFASVGAAGGLSLPMIGALLGHRQAATTLRYAHLSADPMRAAADAIGERIAAAMRGKSAKVANFGHDFEWAQDDEGDLIGSAEGWAIPIVPVEELVREFPTFDVSVSGESTDGDALADPNRVTVSRRGAPLKRGRPPKWDWRAFNEQVILRARRGLPDKQAALEAEMAGWCLEVWGDEPSPSQIRDHVAHCCWMIEKVKEHIFGSFSAR